MNEAEGHSYQHAAESIQTNGQTITKTSEYLYIEADEDHIHRQKDGKEQGCFIGKLVYLFEGKEEICSGGLYI